MTERQANFWNQTIANLMKMAGLVIIIWFIVLREYDLILNIAIWSFGFYFISGKINWLKVIPRDIRKISAVAITMAFGVSALISGSWNESYKIGSIYLGSFHLHHVEWSFFLLLLRLAEIKTVFSDREQRVKENVYRKFSRIEMTIGFVLAALFVFAFLERDAFPNPASFRVLSFVLSFTSFFMAYYLRSVFSKGENSFKLVLCVLFAILLGIFFEGARGYLLSWPNSAKHFSWN